VFVFLQINFQKSPYDAGFFTPALKINCIRESKK
jgi:hypothetical protein